MTNVNQTSGKNDGMSTRYEQENYIGFKIAMVLLAIAFIGLVVFFMTH